MPQAAALATDQRVNRYPIDEFLADIAGIEATTDMADLKRNSRDYYWYSPILADQLKNKVADVAVTPRDEGEVVRVAAACAKHRIPLTVRGGATGNYGQCVPLAPALPWVDVVVAFDDFIEAVRSRWRTAS
jgi:FAD/FMN-containing dehydrogenase